MANLSPASPASTTPAAAPLLVMLPALAAEPMEQLLRSLAEAFPTQPLIVASPQSDEPAPTTTSHPAMTRVSYQPMLPSAAEEWVLGPAEFVAANELLQQHKAAAVLLLGAQSQSLAPAALLLLAEQVLAGRCDLALPRYQLPERSGLLNSGILYPLSRSLFSASARFPLAIDLGLSPRMAAQMAAVAQRAAAGNQPDGLLWPVAEAATAGLRIAQVEAGERTLPAPLAPDVNAILAQVTGSLFTIVEAKAPFWQRARLAAPLPPAVPSTVSSAAPPTPELEAMVEAFRLAHGNLREIWSLVLPPQSLLGLKRTAALPAEAFLLPNPLWARIVYDFVLAYHLRTINRNHLLGALTPLYLAWVASHLRQVADGLAPERHIETAAAAFDADKPYLVSRWRWPDRFNP